MPRDGPTKREMALHAAVTARDQTACIAAMTVLIKSPHNREAAMRACLDAAISLPSAPMVGACLCALTHLYAAERGSVPLQEALALARPYASNLLVTQAAARLVAVHAHDTAFLDSMPTIAEALVQWLKRYPIDATIGSLSARVAVAIGATDPIDICARHGEHAADDVAVALLTAAVASRHLPNGWQPIALKLFPRTRCSR